MEKGRPRKSDAQKKLEGTYRKDRSSIGSLSFSAITKIPKPPDSFDELATDVWNTICGEMIKLQILQNIDIYNLQIICNEMSIYWKCMRHMGDQFMIDTGTGSSKVNPLYTTASQALNNANRLAAQYGFTPAARMRLKMTSVDNKPKENKAMSIIHRKRAIG